MEESGENGCCREFQSLSVERSSHQAMHFKDYKFQESGGANFTDVLRLHRSRNSFLDLTRDQNST